MRDGEIEPQQRMTSQLRISVGQYSDKGRKELNQDFHGVRLPKEPLLSSKGIAIALADGISSSDVSQIASRAAVTGFLEDYYCTSEAWSVRTSAERVLKATNSWLHSQTRLSRHRYDMDRGYVCGLSAMIFKSTTAHIFHVGDTRIYRVHDQALEQLTTDHRVRVSQEQVYLSRAMGIAERIEIDYLALPLAEGDVFVLASDGVYEHAESQFAGAIQDASSDLDTAARHIVGEAHRRGSSDNLTVQVVRVEELPGQESNEILRQLSELPSPPILDARMTLDGFRILREVHASSRSHIYLAQDSETETLVILKTPSIDLRDDPAYLERFMMEEWIARRISNAHVLKPCPQTRKRNYLYLVTEFVDGQTLAQWMIDNPRPDVETVRGIIEQVAVGLQAFHRLEMLHQDLRPANIMIDSTGTVKIIDFGSTQVAGVDEIHGRFEPGAVLGTSQYTAPEYFVGEGGSPRSDIFSLGVITYQMLSGRLPYGTKVAKTRTKAAQNMLRYDSVLDDTREVPTWIDGVLRKAVHPDPSKRYGELSEFMYDLRHPNQEFLRQRRQPLVERNPVLFWKWVSFILAATLLTLLGTSALRQPPVSTNEQSVSNPKP
jgi:serine/threonine protein kinase/serine/threonine protein phosphatase PrpC